MGEWGVAREDRGTTVNGKVQCNVVTARESKNCERATRYLSTTDVPREKLGGRKGRGIAGIHSCAFYNHTILRKSVLPRQTTNGEKQGRGEGERGNHVKSPKVRARREERKRGTVEVRNADEVWLRSVVLEVEDVGAAGAVVVATADPSAEGAGTTSVVTGPLNEVTKPEDVLAVLLLDGVEEEDGLGLAVSLVLVVELVVLAAEPLDAADRDDGDDEEE